MERSTLSIDNLNITINYTYDKDGIRTTKNVNNLETKYFYENGKLIIEKNGSDMIYYIRDKNGNLIGFKYNSELYYYIKNIQNDIIGILDSNCNIVARYTYDSWGELISIKDKDGNNISNNNHIANINPFRYRSYYYDKEIQMYYLNNRYYNPRWGRFINADNVISTDDNILSYNLFIYAFNNPIMYSDVSGMNGVLALAGINPYLAGGIFIAGLIAYGISQTGALPMPTFPDISLPSLPKFNSTPKIKVDSKTKTDALTLAGAVALTAPSPSYREPTPCTTAWINKNTNAVDRGKRLTKEQSVNYVVSGRNVMCDYKEDAEDVAFATSRKVGGYVKEENFHNSDGLKIGEYYNHFHVIGGRIIGRPHIWYIFE